jgi:hypothetical protein
LKDWQRNIPRLAATIENIKLIIQFLDMIEEYRDLEIQENGILDTFYKPKWAPCKNGRDYTGDREAPSIG